MYLIGLDQGRPKERKILPLALTFGKKLLTEYHTSEFIKYKASLVDFKVKYLYILYDWTTTNVNKNKLSILLLFDIGTYLSWSYYQEFTTTKQTTDNLVEEGQTWYDYWEIKKQPSLTGKDENISFYFF